MCEHCGLTRKITAPSSSSNIPYEPPCAVPAPQVAAALGDRGEMPETLEQEGRQPEPPPCRAPRKGSGAVFAVPSCSADVAQSSPEA